MFGYSLQTIEQSAFRTLWLLSLYYKTELKRDNHKILHQAILLKTMSKHTNRSLTIYGDHHSH